MHGYLFGLKSSSVWFPVMVTEREQ